MKFTIRILLVASILLIVITLLPPAHAQAQSEKLSPGTYMGRFRYSAYQIKIDDHDLVDIKTHAEIAQNAYVEGTLTLQVDKNGKIRPGIKFVPDSIPTYYLYTYRIVPKSCNVTGYLEGETKLDLKQNSADSFDPKAPAFSGIVRFSNIIPLSYWQTGTTTDCPGVATRSFLEKGVNEQVRALNKFSVMRFTVVSMSKDQFSGTILLDGYAKKLITQGGYVESKENDGYFNVHKIDPLAPLTEDDLASLVEEWRSK